jgi:hypothetical protein
MVADALVVLGLHLYEQSLKKEKDRRLDECEEDEKDEVASRTHEKEAAEHAVNSAPKRNVSSDTVPPDKKKS